jgi:acetyl-CoA synthetase
MLQATFMDKLLTVEEAARTLKVKTETVRSWLRAGTLRGRKLGRVWRIPEGELHKLLSSDTHSVTASSAAPEQL